MMNDRQKQIAKGHLSDSSDLKIKLVKVILNIVYIILRKSTKDEDDGQYCIKGKL